MQTLEEFEQQETLRKGLTVLGFDVTNLAFWEDELTAQGVNPLPTLAEIETAAGQWTDDQPDWTAFNGALLSDPDWAVVAALLPTDLRYGIVSTAANGNAPGLQAAYGLALTFLDSQGQSLNQTIKDSWQAIADENHIPVAF